MRHYGGGVGHLDPRRIEAEAGPAGAVEDEGVRPDDTGESNETDDDDIDGQSDTSDLETDSDEEDENMY